MSAMLRPIEQFVRTLKASRRVSTPLVAIRTADPALTVTRIADAAGKDAAVVQWDSVRGLVKVNEQGGKEMAKVVGERNAASVGPVDALVLAGELGEDAVLVYANAQRFWNNAEVAQAIWNLRDTFKANGRTLALLTTPGAVLPPELAQDVLVLDEPLPAEEDLSRILEDTIAAAEVPALESDAGGKAVDALLGLAAFPAEQVLAMSLSKKGLDLEQLWETKAASDRAGAGAERVAGWRDVRRHRRVREYQAVPHSSHPGRRGPARNRVLDEIEKAFAGTGTDLSGVKTELTGTVLAWMQDRNADGCILIGPPGAAKSLVAKATGNTARIPTIAFDLGAMQNALVGASGGRLRAALKVVDAVTNGRSLWIATCNSIGTLPPELRRRFTLGTFFFDLPSAEERAAIWEIYWRSTGFRASCRTTTGGPGRRSRSVAGRRTG